MPSEAENEFYTLHQAEINKLAREENKRRRQAGVRQLTPEEGQLVISSLIKFLSENPEATISDYQIDIPYTEEVVEETAALAPRIKKDSNQIDCYFVPCENGYLAKIGQRNYIFKSEKELVNILKPILFKEINE